VEYRGNPEERHSLLRLPHMIHQVRMASGVGIHTGMEKKKAGHGSPHHEMKKDGGVYSTQNQKRVGIKKKVKVCIQENPRCQKVGYLVVAEGVRDEGGMIIHRNRRGFLIRGRIRFFVREDLCISLRQRTIPMILPPL